MKLLLLREIVIVMIRPIQSEIILVINKSDSPPASQSSDFVYPSYDILQTGDIGLHSVLLPLLTI